jgi:hypothetical protein
MTDIEIKEEQPQELEQTEQPEQPILKPKSKKGPKKHYDRTEKQKEQFKIAMAKRQENIKKTNEQKKIDAMKLLLEKDYELQHKKKAYKTTNNTY